MVIVNNRAQAAPLVQYPAKVQTRQAAERPQAGPPYYNTTCPICGAITQQMHCGSHCPRWRAVVCMRHCYNGCLHMDTRNGHCRFPQVVERMVEK